ncbi:uncharacterized protein TRIADDRAFT_59520 [Trichoplax adhaerens]|uniref:G-protein coupled receptors family 1 profile domain-containing protein n=1 Tax=Trichoplax adhaerens TaxID=10228 RepID=B3S5M7_TRIAD|nr:hypothetical protein TRIADDRAFT_59520 [Trichoplax adhaerens]EDV21869.1 hypothetical protein TRIADDRAFT_59520 [Trichoplax adhaerens]|eukprot:XP_002115506.1 hypothetical protein TRIADDRAFT_59520 [Trichoplax adhaerens]
MATWPITGYFSPSDHPSSLPTTTLSSIADGIWTTSASNATSVPSSNYTYYLPPQLVISTWNIAFIVIYAALLTIGVPANIFVLVVIYRSPKLKGVANYYLINLMYADLLVLSINVPFSLITDIMHENRHYMLGNAICKLSPAISQACFYTMSLTLTIISVDRYFQVVYPSSKFWITKSVVLVISSIWLISSLLVIPTLIFVSTENIRGMKLCVNLMPSNIRSVYRLLVVIIIYLIPFVIMLYCNFHMLIAVLRTGKTTSSNQIANKMKKRVMVIVSLIILAFVVCIAPSQIYKIFLEYSVIRISAATIIKISVVCRTVAYFDTLINPILYAALNTRFREGCKDITHSFINRRFTALPGEISRADLILQTKNQSLAIKELCTPALAITICHDEITKTTDQSC